MTTVNTTVQTVKKNKVRRYYLMNTESETAEELDTL
jgi:hypothetical protein